MAVIEAIKTTYLEADVVTVTMSGIPGTYEHLQLRISARSTRTSSTGWVRLGPNGDTSTGNKSHHRMQGFGNGGSSGVTDASTSSLIFYHMPSDYDADAVTYGSMVIDILDYANTNKYTTFQQVSGWAGQGADYAVFGSGLWAATTTMTSITLDSTDAWTRGSEFTLYGLNSS
jgi:hypothetical protein